MATLLTKELLLADIDWAQEDVVFETKSGVTHTKKQPGEELSSNRIKIFQGTYKHPIYISVKGTGEDSYLSIKGYTIPRGYWSVKDYKSLTVEESKLIDAISYYWYGTEFQNLVPYGLAHTVNRVRASEIRVYKDRSVVSVIYVDIKRGAYSYQCRETDNPDATVFIVNPRSDTAKIITTEEEIRENAVHPTKKSIDEYMLNLRANRKDIHDLRDHSEIYGNHGEDINLHKDTQKIIRDFFDLDNDENLYKAYLRSGGRKNPEITTIEELCDLLTVRKADVVSNPIDTKEARLVELVSHFQDTFDSVQFDKDCNNAYWYRIGDDIVLLYVGTSWEYRNNHKLRFVFSYNLKTKKRLCGEYDGVIWKINIPSWKYITGICDLTGASDYCNGADKTKTHICCKGGIKELFANSNMAYLLENAGDEYLLTSRWEGRAVKVKDVLNEKCISRFVFAVIFSTGMPVLEQFLKSGLYNLYFNALEKWGNTWLYENKDKISSKTDPAYKLVGIHEDHGDWEYLSRQKNLKKMFGMTIDQLRYLNEKYKLQDSNSHYYNNHDSVKERVQVYLYGAEYLLGVNLCDLDKDTFDLVINFDTSKAHRFSFYSLRQLKDSLKNLSPKQRMKILTDLKSAEISTWSYEDYLHMRDQLQQAQTRHPDIPGIYDEKDYPVIPRPCKKFVAFREGVRDPFFPYATVGGYGYTLLNRYKDRFGCGSSSVTPIYNNGVLLGVLLNLDMKGALQYLHDIASYWISFYQDETKNEDLKEAVKRVEPLVWKDEESGLEVIAPKDLADLKQEGAVLSHCVASYADAIIADRSNIMFLRRSDMINSPYYTIEILSDGAIRQVHCYHNGDLTIEGQKGAYTSSNMPVYNKTFDLIKFLQNWAKAKKGKIKMSTIQSRYGALCAR